MNIISKLRASIELDMKNPRCVGRHLDAAKDNLQKLEEIEKNIIEMGPKFEEIYGSDIQDQETVRGLQRVINRAKRNSNVI